MTRSPSRQVKLVLAAVTASILSSHRGRDLLALLVPRERVVGLVEVARERRQLQRLERVPHHRELLGAPGAERLLHEARLRAVGQAAGVQRDHPDVYALARAELAVDVVDG